MELDVYTVEVILFGLLLLDEELDIPILTPRLVTNALLFCSRLSELLLPDRLFFPILKLSAFFIEALLLDVEKLISFFYRRLFDHLTALLQKTL